MTTPEPDDAATTDAMPPDAASRAACFAEVHRDFAASAVRRRELAKTTALRRFGVSLISLLSGGRVKCADVPPL
jgi:hypothetical protein